MRCLGKCAKRVRFYGDLITLSLSVEDAEYLKEGLLRALEVVPGHMNKLQLGASECR